MFHLNNIQKEVLDIFSNNKSEIKILLFGPAGLGKTTYANEISKKSNKNIKILQGPLLKRKIDFFNILPLIDKKTIIFIDEIHSISKTVQELLYSLIDNKKITINIGKNFEVDEITFEIENINIIGATTNLEKLNNSFTSRFTYLIDFSNYDYDILIKICNDLLSKYRIKLNKKEVNTLINISSGNPRTIKNNILKLNDLKKIENREYFNKLLLINNLNNEGISKRELEYLKILSDSSKSLSYISSLMNLSTDYIKLKIEPNLIDKELIKITNKGRSLTKNAKIYFN